MKSRTKIIYQTATLASVLAFFTILSLSFTEKQNTGADKELMTVVVKYTSPLKYAYGQKLIISQPNKESVIRYLGSNATPLSLEKAKD